MMRAVQPARRIEHVGGVGTAWRTAGLLFGLAALGLAGLLSLRVGSIGISTSDAWDALFRYDADVYNQTVVRTLRLPRTIIALGIGAALVMRLVLLAAISYIVQLTQPVFSLFGHDFSWRDLILIAGGLFLVWKATKEIHHSVDPDDHKESMVGEKMQLSLAGAIFQILLLDLVFSVDSIITAVGMTDEIGIMYIAVIVAVSVMMIAAGPLANFIAKNPSIVMLALGFLLMIGMTLIADGMGYHVPKGYIYAAMGFSALVEALNMLARRRRKAGQGGGH